MQHFRKLIDTWRRRRPLKWDEEKFTDQVSDYLKDGGDPNLVISDIGWTLLHLAAEYSNPDAVRLLVASGGNPNIKDTFGQSPLYLSIDSATDSALQTGSTISFATTAALVAAGADIGLTTNNGETGWDIARRFGEEVEQLLRSIVG